MSEITLARKQPTAALARSGPRTTRGVSARLLERAGSDLERTRLRRGGFEEPQDAAGYSIFESVIAGAWPELGLTAATSFL